MKYVTLPVFIFCLMFGATALVIDLSGLSRGKSKAVVASHSADAAVIGGSVAGDVAVVPKVKRESACPEDMVEVEGDYCPKVSQVCEYYVDTHGNKIPPGKMPEQTGRCGRFTFPTICLSKVKEHKHFCIDRFEFPNIEGHIPESWMTWYDAEREAKIRGKRMCKKSEWVFSCEGKDMKPYSYGTGYLRDTVSCNTDRDLPPFDRFKDTKQLRYMDRLLVPSGSMPNCRSDFGVMNQLGSLDEFVINESGHPYKSSLVGGDSVGVRNRCRVSTDAHSPNFGWWETSTRLCKDPQ